MRRRLPTFRAARPRCALVARIVLCSRSSRACKAVVTGDIGCYTLGALPPLSAMDTCIDMGASVSMSHGFELALRGHASIAPSWP